MAMDDELEPDFEPEEEYVPAAFARSHEEAEAYCELLRDHDIPALISDEVEEEEDDDEIPHRGMTHGVAVLVPESMLDEAGAVVAEQEDLDEYVTKAEDEEEEDEEDDEFELEGFEEEEVEDDLFDADEDSLEEDDEEF